MHGAGRDELLGRGGWEGLQLSLSLNLSLVGLMQGLLGLLSLLLGLLLALLLGHVLLVLDQLGLLLLGHVRCGTRLIALPAIEHLWRGHHYRSSGTSETGGRRGVGHAPRRATGAGNCTVKVGGRLGVARLAVGGHTHVGLLLGV